MQRGRCFDDAIFQLSYTVLADLSNEPEETILLITITFSNLLSIRYDDHTMIILFSSQIHPFPFTFANVLDSGRGKENSANGNGARRKVSFPGFRSS